MPIIPFTKFCRCLLFLALLSVPNCLASIHKRSLVNKYDNPISLLEAIERGEFKTEENYELNSCYAVGQKAFIAPYKLEKILTLSFELDENFFASAFELDEGNFASIFEKRDENVSSSLHELEASDAQGLLINSPVTADSTCISPQNDFKTVLTTTINKPILSNSRIVSTTKQSTLKRETVLISKKNNSRNKHVISAPKKPTLPSKKVASVPKKSTLDNKKIAPKIQKSNVSAESKSRASTSRSKKVFNESSSFSGREACLPANNTRPNIYTDKTFEKKFKVFIQCILELWNKDKKESKNQMDRSN